MSSGVRTRWGWFVGIASWCAIAFSKNSAIAQITPDRTLPNNSSVTREGNTFNINANSLIIHEFSFQGDGIAVVEITFTLHILNTQRCLLEWVVFWIGSQKIGVVVIPNRVRFCSHNTNNNSNHESIGYLCIS